MPQMKPLLISLILAAMLIGCSKTDEKAKAALQVQADIAKAKLQEKADALAKTSPVQSEKAQP